MGGGGYWRIEDLKIREETSREESELRDEGALREEEEIIMRVGKGERRGGISVIGNNEEGQGGTERVERKFIEVGEQKVGGGLEKKGGN